MRKVNVMRCWKQVSVLGLAMGVSAVVRAQPQPQPQAPAPPTPAQEPRVVQVLRANEEAAAAQAAEAQARYFYALRGKKEKAAFLGVSGSPVPVVLREQLRLPRGVGMVVDYVEPKSPAEEAGIKQYDVLHKLDDQLVINASQFAVLVRMHKAGDEISLTLFRHGESTQVKAKLTEKEVVAMDEQNPWGAPPNPWPQPSGADVLIGRPPGQAGVEMRVPVLSEIPFLKDVFAKNPNAVGEMRWSDDKTDLSLSIRGNNRRLVVKDKSGKVLFEGSIDTPDERERVPRDLRPKLDRLEGMQNRIRLRGPTTLPMRLQSVPGFGQPGLIRLRTGDQELSIEPPEGVIRVDPVEVDLEPVEAAQ
jgi:serine protease Do